MGLIDKFSKIMDDAMYGNDSGSQVGNSIRQQIDSLRNRMAPPPPPSSRRATPPPTPKASTPPPPPGAKKSASDNLYSDRLHKLIDIALADGVLTDSELSVLRRKATEEGIDPDEFEMVLGSLLKEKQDELLKAKMKETAAAPSVVTATPVTMRPTPPTQKKSGGVTKCPNCGEPVESFTAKCSACGYEFRNVGNSSAIESFSRQLMIIRNKPRKFWDDDEDDDVAKFVKTYPVPNTKEDLLEFTLLCAHSYDREESSLENDAWKNKTHECWDRACIALRNDPESLGQIQNILVGKKLLKVDKEGNVTWKKKRFF